MSADVIGALIAVPFEITILGGSRDVLRAYLKHAFLAAGDTREANTLSVQTRALYRYRMP